MNSHLPIVLTSASRTNFFRSSRKGIRPLLQCVLDGHFPPSADVTLLLSVEARYAQACFGAELALVKTITVELEAPGFDAIAYQVPRVPRRHLLLASGEGSRVPSENILNGSGAFSIEATFSGSVLAVGTGALAGASPSCFEAVAVEFDAIRPRTAASSSVLLKWSQVQSCGAKEFQAAWITVDEMIICWLHALCRSWLVERNRLFRDHWAVAEGLCGLIGALRSVISPVMVIILRPAKLTRAIIRQSRGSQVDWR